MMPLAAGNGKYQLNTAKQGNYLPGTGHLIVPFSELDTREIEVALLMNPNYRRENQTLLDSSGIRTRLIE